MLPTVLSSTSRFALGAAFALAGVACFAPPAEAFCTSGSVAILSNSCTTFNPASASQATIKLVDAKLNNSLAPLRPGARYFQIAINTALGGSYTITDFEWARSSGGPFSTFQASLAVGATRVATGITDILAASGTSPLGNPFFVRYTLPAGVAVGEAFEVKFLANNNGAVDANGFLTGSSLTSFVDLNRDHTSAVPGPLPAVGVLMALGKASKYRRRLRIVSEAE